MKPKLSIVTDKPVDITLVLREEIMIRDWSAVHVAGDRRSPVELAGVRKRGWR